MSDNELPTVATKDAVCHIDFEFQMPYHEPLTSKELLEECISIATSEVLSTTRSSNGQLLTLPTDSIEIPEIDLRPNEQTPKRIKVSGWITCNDNQRQIYMDALQLAQQSRKISKQIANKTNVKRTKIQIQQFNSRFSNAHHVNKSFIDSTATNNFKEFKKRSNSLLSNPENDNGNDSENKNDSTPPLTNLYEGNSSVVVHDDINETDINYPNDTPNNNSTNDDEEYDIISKQSTNDNNDTSHDNSSFQLVDELNANEQDEQSSNEEHKSPTQSANEENNMSDNMEDYRQITPIISSAMNSDKEEDELIKLRLEIAELKTKHAEERNHFQNKVNILKEKIKKETNERKVERQRSRISMQIDDDIIKKQIKQETDVEVEKLHSELRLKEKEQNVNLQQLQLKHNAELQKFDYKLRQTQQLHTLELSNIRNQHKYQSEQLQSQIRGLTGALERESQKDRKIYELTEEIETLKASKDKIISNYETAIEKLNNDSEDSIRQEIDKRIKETAAFKREINDLKSKMNRENNIKKRLETQLKQLQNDMNSKDNVITQMRDMFIKEKKKSSQLEKKLMKNRSKRNILAEKDEIKKKKEKEELLNSGGHTRKKSKTMKNVFVKTEKNIETGDTVITLEKTDEPFNILSTMTEEDLNDINSDSDGYDNDEQKINSSGVMMDRDQHDQEVVLKEQEIESLKEKIRRGEEEMQQRLEEKNEELRALQQKIGSLQQQIEIQDENFLKQNQMLEFKLKKKENDSKKLSDDFDELKRSQRKELRQLNETIDQIKRDLMEKEREIQNLEQNLDMIEEENARLKENDEIIADYEAELEEIDNHYQDMLDGIKRQNEATQSEFKDLVIQRESENESLKKKVHTQTKSIAELHTLLESMQDAETQLEDKQARIEQILAEKENNNNNNNNNKQVIKKSRQSVELKEADLNGNDSQWRGQAQMDAPQPDSQPQTPTKGNDHDNNSNNSAHGSRQSLGNGIDISDYILREDMDSIIAERIEEGKKKLEMSHALEIDTIEGKLKNQFNVIETRLNENIKQLENDKNQLVNQLNENRNTINILQTQVTNSENNKIKLLNSFMREMDRMRDEIKKLNRLRNKRK